MTKNEEEQLMKMIPQLFDIIKQAAELKGENEALKKENKHFLELLKNRGVREI